jgi:tRNA(Ile)-lysidine synthase TilS/MesJ
LKIENLSSAEKKLIDKNNRLVGKAIHKYNLINEGDRIAIGISGGKDSFILLESLALRLKYSPIKYSIFPVHIKIEEVPYSIDENYVEKICKDMGLNFYVKSLSIDFDHNYQDLGKDFQDSLHRGHHQDLDTSNTSSPSEVLAISGTSTQKDSLNKDKKISQCFICSWNRRKELFKFCREHNCNKLALGHHLDDAIQTLIMNLIFQGSISSMPADLKLFDGDVSIIRPLLLLPEQNLIDHALAREYPKEKKMCPYSDESSRNSIKAIISEMEKLNPRAKSSIFAAMGNIHGEYLPK